MVAARLGRAERRDGETLAVELGKGAIGHEERPGPSSSVAVPVITAHAPRRYTLDAMARVKLPLPYRPDASLAVDKAFEAALVENVTVEAMAEHARWSWSQSFPS